MEPPKKRQKIQAPDWNIPACNNYVTRSHEEAFNWRTCCFICGQLCNPKSRSSWSLVTSGNKFVKTIEAAKMRSDWTMIRRLSSTNGDLVALGARYHRSKKCYVTYINSRNICGTQENEQLLDAVKVDTCIQEEEVITTDEDIPLNELPTHEDKNAQDERIIHQAIHILRSRIIKNTNKLQNEYFSSSELDLKSQADHVDTLLLKALSWLKKGTPKDSSKEPNIELDIISIASDITAMVSSVPSPKHLGLAVHLHHSYGSRKLIETVHNLGHCISYTELRHFLTSAASHTIDQQQQSTVKAYIPPELDPINDGGQVLLAAADNWDHNERTVDGTKTTHAMTSIITQQVSGTSKSPERIKRSTKRSLSKQTGNNTFAHP